MKIASVNKFQMCMISMQYKIQIKLHLISSFTKNLEIMIQFYNNY